MVRMTSEDEQKTILVLGGTGKTGRRIVRRLHTRVSRLVLLSGRGDEEAPAAENLVAATGIWDRG